MAQMVVLSGQCGIEYVKPWSKEIKVLLSKSSFFLIQICSKLLLFSHSAMSDSLRPHGLQHTRLPCPWDFPGTNTGAVN